MTDQFQWQPALAAAERAIRDEQIEVAADSLRIALTRIGTYEPNDPARLPILATFIRCCERAIERLAEQSILAMRHRTAEVQRVMTRANERSPLTYWQAAAQLPDDSEERRRLGKVKCHLQNCQITAHSRLLDSQVAQLGEDADAVVATLLILARLEWDRNEFKSFPLLHQALAIRERTRGNDHPETLEIVQKLAAWYDTLSSYREAIPFWQRLLNYVERAGPQTHGSFRYEASGLIFMLGVAYSGSYLHDDARKTWYRYLAMTQHEPEQEAKELTRVGTNRLYAYYSIGRACLAQERWEEAANLLAIAVEQHRAIPAHIADSGNGVSPIDLATGIAAYARAAVQEGSYDKVLHLCREAIVLYQRRDQQYAELLGTYAIVLRALGNEQKAAAIEQEASALKEQIEAKQRRWRFRRSALP